MLFLLSRFSSLRGVSEARLSGALYSLRDCPPDKDALGSATWTLLHTVAAQYPEKPDPQQRKDVGEFIQAFAKVL